MKKELDPWSTQLISDYDYLFKEFGLQHFDAKLQKKLSGHRLYRRGIVFAHRDFDQFVQASKNKQPTAVMTGIKPSGEFHLGSKMTAEEIIFLQKQFNSRLFYAIADVEAYADNGLNFQQSHQNAVDNVADLLALGLDPEKTFVYKQSENMHVNNLANIFARKTTLNTLEALYGHQNLALYLAVLTQAGDILAPQLDAFDGPKHTVVPVGIDQDPHIRFTRDLSAKFKDEFGFITPAATFHKFFRALNGETKMSKRDPLNIMTLNDDNVLLKKKLANALTGGRATAEEQRRLGANPYVCVVFELMKYHFYDDDSALKDMEQDCKSGKLLCGECKAIRLKHIQEYYKKHQEKKKKARAQAEQILEQPIAFKKKKSN
ncbi:tryptophan--tRNA ligase [Candidatus Micrarchaeota archaeon]|nr:tryptophan--tRNA ligase [Candidatus Micrarchaeota archaeon]